MKLKELVEKIDNQKFVNEECFKELEKRKKQLKKWFQLYKNDITVIIETVSNIIQLYYIDTNEIGAFDLIEEYDLGHGLETGHIQIVEV